MLNKNKKADITDIAIIGVKDVEASMVGKEKDKPKLKLRFDLASGSVGTLSFLINQYSPDEIKALLKALNFTGSDEDFIADTSSERTKNFNVSFSQSVPCRVSKETFKNEENGEDVEWYKVHSVSNVFVVKQDTFQRIDKKTYVASFGSLKDAIGNPQAGSESAPF